MKSFGTQKKALWNVPCRSANRVSMYVPAKKQRVEIRLNVPSPSAFLAKLIKYLLVVVEPSVYIAF